MLEVWVEKADQERLTSNKKEGGSFYEEKSPRYPAERKGICRTGGLEENVAAMCS
jgi:hypothetical protein